MFIEAKNRNLRAIIRGFLKIRRINIRKWWSKVYNLEKTRWDINSIRVEFVVKGFKFWIKAINWG